MQPLLFLDCETTGFNRPRLVQLAWEHHPTGEKCNAVFLPPVPVDEGASAVHGWTMDRLQDKPAFRGSDHYVKTQQMINESIVVAHHAQYDIGVLRNEGLAVPRWICTCNVARRLIPGSMNHKLQYLKESLGFYIPEGDVTAHSAHGDVLVLQGLFAHLFQIQKEKLPEDEKIIDYFLTISL